MSYRVVDSIRSKKSSFDFNTSRKLLKAWAHFSFQSSLFTVVRDLLNFFFQNLPVMGINTTFFNLGKVSSRGLDLQQIFGVSCVFHLLQC